METPPIDLTNLLLLGDTSLLEAISRAISAGPQRTEVLLFLCGAGSLVVLILLLARVFGRESRAEAKHRTDYLTLAVDLLGLSESDRRDLHRIARGAKLAQPAAMLLSPMNLAHAIALAPPKIAGDQELRGRLEDLCLRLFDTPLPGAGRAPAVY